MTTLFDSLDYRTFMKQQFDAMKEDRPWFSYRLIAQKLEMDPGLFVKVLQGQRHISERYIPIVASYLKLNDGEKDFFACLVRYNKAKSASDIKLYFEKMSELKGMILPKVSEDQDRFYHKWYYSVIRVLFTYYKFDGDYAKLGAQLSPPISEAEAREAVELLHSFGFLVKGDDGSFTVSEKFISGGGNWRMLAVRHFQQQTIQLSERSLVNDPPEVRDVSSLTISIPTTMIDELKEMLKDFRQLILRRVMDADTEPDSVFQLNLQLIPVTGVTKQPDQGKKQ